MVYHQLPSILLLKSNWTLLVFEACDHETFISAQSSYNIGWLEHVAKSMWCNVLIYTVGWILLV